MKQTFEEYLQEICPCQTNNSPEGFENWLADKDVEDIIELAEHYGKSMFTRGETKGIRETTESWVSKK
jgi:hypothetical protein